VNCNFKEQAVKTGIPNRTGMEKTVRIYDSPEELAEAFARELASSFRNATEKGSVFTVALSGGSTPSALYSLLAEKYADSVNWKYIHFFWGDERCVPPDDPESNYGMAFDKFLGRIDIPPGNIHRIAGEGIPSVEALRYSGEILLNTRSFNGLPVFNHFILGMGEDGHIVSIFPSNREMFHSDKICDVAVHPVTGQKRITVTGKVINNSESVTFLVTGKSKAETVERIFMKDNGFPASDVMPYHGRLAWLLDKEAASKISGNGQC
jgi:6-phosphogluconolactonase